MNACLCPAKCKIKVGRILKLLLYLHYFQSLVSTQTITKLLEMYHSSSSHYVINCLEAGFEPSASPYQAIHVFKYFGDIHIEKIFLSDLL